MYDADIVSHVGEILVLRARQISEALQGERREAKHSIQLRDTLQMVVMVLALTVTTPTESAGRFSRVSESPSHLGLKAA